MLLFQRHTHTHRLRCIKVVQVLLENHRNVMIKTAEPTSAKVVVSHLCLRDAPCRPCCGSDHPGSPQSHCGVLSSALPARPRQQGAVLGGCRREQQRGNDNYRTYCPTTQLRCAASSGAPCSTRAASARRAALTWSVNVLHGPPLEGRQQAQVSIGDRRNTKQDHKCSLHALSPYPSWSRALYISII